MPDEGGVDDKEERLGDQRAERGEGERRDPAVYPAAGTAPVGRHATESTTPLNRVPTP